MEKSLPPLRGRVPATRLSVPYWQTQPEGRVAMFGSAAPVAVASLAEASDQVQHAADVQAQPQITTPINYNHFTYLLGALPQLPIHCAVR